MVLCMLLLYLVFSCVCIGFVKKGTLISFKKNKHCSVHLELVVFSQLVNIFSLNFSDYMKSGPLLNAMPPIFGKAKMTTFQPSFLFWKLNYFSRDFDEWGQSKSIVHLYSGSSSEINQEKMKVEEDAEYRICRLDAATYI